MEPYNETDPMILQLLETRSFGELNETEKQMVLSQFTESEYNDLFRTLALIGKHSVNVNPESKERVRVKLLEEYDSFFPDKPSGPVFKLNHILRYAAVLLLLAGLSYLFIKPSGNDGKSLLAGIQDTVYVETIKLVPQLIRDTVFVNTGKTAELPGKTLYYAASRSTTTGYSQLNILNDVNIVKVQELNSAVNESRGRSIRDDTLIASVGFLTY